MIKDRTRVNETEQLSLDTLDSNSEQIKKDAFTIYSHLFFKDFFFDVNHFENLYIISYNNASVLCFVLFCFFFFMHKACGILTCRSGIELAPPALECEVLNTREAPYPTF